MLASQNWVREKCIQQSAKLLEFDKLGDTSLTPSQVGDIQDNCLMSDTRKCRTLRGGASLSELIQEYYVTDEWMSDVTSKFLMFSAS